MTRTSRSPFGELLRQRRRRLGLSQEGLALRTLELYSSGRTPSPVSKRTIERAEGGPNRKGEWTIPQASNVLALAETLGFVEGTPDFEVFLDAAQMRGPGRDADGFVSNGREPYLSHLRQAIKDAVSGTPRVVLVGGIAGAGKTWLIQEACRQAAERFPNLVIAWGSCTDPDIAGGWTQNLEPIRQHLRRMLEVPESISSRRVDHATALRIPTAAKALVSEGPGLVSNLIPDLDLWRNTVARHVDPGILDRAESIIMSPAFAERLVTTLAEQHALVLAAYAADGPLVLVVDDLHWADTETIFMLAHLVGQLRTRSLPIVIIAAFRPTELPFDALIDQVPISLLVDEVVPRHFPGSTLDLTAATGHDAGLSFVEGMLEREGLAGNPELARKLHDRAGGLPLFVDGFLRLHEQLANKPDALSRSLDEPIVPDSARAVYAAQLRKLPPELRMLLGAASIQGDAFLVEPIGEVLGLPLARINEMRMSPELQQYRMLQSAGTVKVAGHIMHRYRFTHALLRSHIIDRLGDDSRTSLHRRTAEAMIELWGDHGHASTSDIAHHFERAGDLARAVPAWHQAGVDALLAHDHRRAIAHFEHVLHLVDHDQNRPAAIRATIGLGNCHLGLGHIDRATAFLDRALELATTGQDATLRADALESRGLIDFDAGNMFAGEERLREVIDIRLRTGNQVDAARAMTNLAFLLHGQGKYDSAMDLAHQAAAATSSKDMSAIWIDARTALGICQIDFGNYDTARKIIDETREIAIATGDRHREFLCWFNLSICWFEQEEWDTAQAAINVVLDANPPATSRLQAMCRFNAGIVAAGLGDFVAAREYFAASLETRRNTDQAAAQIDSLAGLLTVAVATGNVDEARRLHDTIVSRIGVRGLDGIEHVGRMYLALIDATVMLGLHDQRESHVRSAVQFLRSRADNVNDPILRQSYLRQPPTHRRIMELAEAA